MACPTTVRCRSRSGQKCPDFKQRLKDKFQLIVPDMRGYNLSDKPDGIENYKLDILIEDIKGLSEKLGFTEFNLAGLIL